MHSCYDIAVIVLVIFHVIISEANINAVVCLGVSL
jgi:hypothetical protein